MDITDERGGDFPAIAVTGDGVVHAVYWTRTGVASQPAPSPPPVRPIQYVESTDRGRTFSKPRPVDPGNQRADRPPLLAADPRAGALYMAWYANADPNNAAPGFKGDMDIFFRASLDGGRTWGERLTVNDDGPGTAHQFDVGISVAPGGRVDLAWMDGRDSPVPVDTSSQTAKGFQDVFYASSPDRGRTFSANRRVSDRSIDRSIGTYANSIESHHNTGITSTDHEVWFAWQDSRNGNAVTGAEDVYATSLRFDAAVSSGRTAGGGASPLALAAAVLLGMGVAASGLWLVARTQRPGPRPVRRA